ncbi:MAG: ABC transporter permease [Oscillospiraceae bacterium]|jgi:ribose/xylose/arabinose/galactoside ABC-type transport system permease subunit|nr:ABC transporter permease [Oscillospiraceae bacterium]
MNSIKQKDSKLRLFTQSKMFSLLLLLVLEVVVFTVWAWIKQGGNSFLTFKSLTTIINTMTVPGFLALGAAFLMISGNIDLSSASIGAFGAMFIAASIQYFHFTWWLAIACALVIAIAFGVLNAVLVNEFRFQPFIATMAMSSVIKGLLAFISMDPKAAAPVATTITLSPQVVDFLGGSPVKILEFIGKKKFFAGSAIEIPFNIILLIAAFIIYGVILRQTKFGMKVYLVGGNPMAARLVGVNPKKVSYILFANSAFAAGIAGVITHSKTLQGSSIALQADTFTGLTAAMLGGISFGGGSGGMGGAFIGLLITRAFAQGMLAINASSYITTAFSGVLLIIALSIDFASQRRATARAIKGV